MEQSSLRRARRPQGDTDRKTPYLTGTAVPPTQTIQHDGDGKIAPAGPAGPAGPVAADSIPEYLCLLFGVVSFGYMCAWTSLGSLISYYKHNYGPSFYNRIYCAYYLPGLPVALLQHKYDSLLDRRYGARNAYLARGIFSLNLMIFCILSLVWVKNVIALICLFGVMGTCSWLIHGTASMLAAMYPPRSIGYLQTGFRSPEVFTVIALQWLDIGKDPTPSHLGLFYSLIAMMVWLGMCSWVALVAGDVSRGFFDDIDASNAEDPTLQQYSTSYPQLVLPTSRGVETPADSDDETCIEGRGGGGEGLLDLDYGATPGVRLRQSTRAEAVESSPLLGNKSVGGGGGGGGGGKFSMSTSFYGTPHRPSNHAANSPPGSSTPERTKRVVRGRGKAGQGRDSEAWLDHLGRRDDNSISVDALDEEKGGRWRQDRNQEGDTYFGDGDGDVDGDGDWDDTTGMLTEHALASRPTHRPFSREGVQATVRPLCWALFLTMATSIFQASFFAYAESTGDRNIEQILYFTRLFCDLFGRPLATMAPRPWFVRTPQLVLVCSIYRLVLFAVFFAYIFVPGFWQSDMLVSLLVGAFSLVNGYFSVLIYEYASDCVASEGRNAQAYATTLLNIVFQGAAFLAVCSSTAFLLVVPVPVHPGADANA